MKKLTQKERMNRIGELLELIKPPVNNKTLNQQDYKNIKEFLALTKDLCEATVIYEVDKYKKQKDGRE